MQNYIYILMILFKDQSTCLNYEFYTWNKLLVQRTIPNNNNEVIWIFLNLDNFSSKKLLTKIKFSYIPNVWKNHSNVFSTSCWKPGNGTTTVLLWIKSTWNQNKNHNLSKLNAARLCNLLTCKMIIYIYKPYYNQLKWFSWLWPVTMPSIIVWISR